MDKTDEILQDIRFGVDYYPNTGQESVGKQMQG